MGHVDHGKTTLLDSIRGTSVASREPGQITQWIGASFIPRQVIERLCSELLRKFRFQVMVPGLLFIDTPGHETFSNLRRRGGSAADIAVLVIDIAQGIQPQTLESINILKSRKTPFLVVANKIDLIPGWKSYEDLPFSETLLNQRPEVQEELDNRIYTLIGHLSRLGFQCDRYDRIKDFTRTISIVPASAKTGEGLADLMAMLVGLTQTYMKDRLSVKGEAGRGTVLEVEEEPGLGATVNVILYDGSLKTGDRIVLAGRDGPIATTVRAIFLPRPLEEIREPSGKFSTVERVTAAAGVKVAGPDLESALAGSPIFAVPMGEDVTTYVKLVTEEVESLRVSTDTLGIVVKADTLGSLEALTTSLSNMGIPIRLADIGDVSKRDVVEAATVKLKEPVYGVVLAFNVRLLPDAEEEASKEGLLIFRSNVIYHLIEEYQRWLEQEKAKGIEAQLQLLTLPGKIRILPGHVFRRSKPAIVGVEVIAGRIRPKFDLMNAQGQRVGTILRIQDKGKDIPESRRGAAVAISLDKPTVGRQVNEGDVLYVALPEAHAKALSSKFKELLGEDEFQVLGEVVKIMREQNPIWAL